MARLPSAPQHQVRRRIKTLREDLDAVLTAQNGDKRYFDAVASAKGLQGPIRVIVRARASFPEKWAMSIIFQDERIDGIDWENVVKDHRGSAHNCSGWHRHMWKASGGDKHKECLPAFNPKSLDDFALQGFDILNVRLGRSTGDGNRLRFD